MSDIVLFARGMTVIVLLVLAGVSAILGFLLGTVLFLLFALAISGKA